MEFGYSMPASSLPDNLEMIAVEEITRGEQCIETMMPDCGDVLFEYLVENVR